MDWDKIIVLGRQKGIPIFLRGDADYPMIIASFQGEDFMFKPAETLQLTHDKLQRWLEAQPDLSGKEK